MGKKSTPSAPDPTAVANAQSAANVQSIDEAAKVNRYGTVTPYGTTSWQTDPNAPGTQQYQKQLSDYNTANQQYQQQLQAYNTAKSQSQRSLSVNGLTGEATARGGTSAGSPPVAPVAPKAPSADPLANQQQVTTLAPAQQQQLDQQNQVAGSLGDTAEGLTGQVANEAATPFNYNGIPAGPTDYSTMQNNATNQTYDELTHNLNRDFNNSDETLQAKLASQGISQDSPAYERSMEAQNNSRDSALNTAALNASQEGLAQEQAAYGQDTTTRQNAINQALTLRQEPMNELSAILQGTPALQTPQAPATAQYQPLATDVTGPTYSSYQGQLNAANQQSSKFGSTIGNLAGTAALLYKSDHDLKENMEPINVSILDRLQELPVEFWSYKPDTAKTIPGDNSVKHIGCYAGDFKDLFGVGDGHQISVVDIFGVLTQAIKELTAKVRSLENGV